MSANLTCNATGDGAASTTSDTISLIVSIILTIAGAAVLAYSMTVQRYGLSGPKYVKLCGCNWHRLLIWFVGICLYGLANGLKVTAFNLGPFSVLGSVFTVVLIFNLIFARWLLKETITWPKIASSATILVGAIICTIGAPADVQTVFTPSDISTLFAGHVPFVAILTILMSTALVGIIYVECVYPMTAEARAAAKGDTKPAQEDTTAADAKPAKLPPKWLDGVMAVVYPGSLGFDESLADLLIRAWTAMLGACTGGLCDGDSGVPSLCDQPVVYASIGFWVLLSFGGSLLWMPIVYQRYEVSVALPIEYGALNACTVLSGLLFYDEHKFMQGWQLACQVAGAIIILIGIGIGRIPAKGSEGEGPPRTRAAA